MDIGNTELTKQQIHAKNVAEYRKKNPDKVREQLYSYWKKPYICDCGTIITQKHKIGHIKSKKHTRNMEILENFKQKQMKKPITV